MEQSQQIQDSPKWDPTPLLRKGPPLQGEALNASAPPGRRGYRGGLSETEGSETGKTCFSWFKLKSMNKKFLKENENQTIKITISKYTKPYFSVLER